MMGQNFDRDDERLLTAVCGGDREALARLYERHGALCRGRAFAVLRDRSLAEDAVQEAFVDLWRTSDRFDRRRGAVVTWLCVLVHRRAVDLTRREIARRRAADRLPAPSRSEYAAEEQVLLLVERRRVRAALERLGSEQRELVELAYYGGLTQRELSYRLGLPLGTIKSRMSAAMTALASILTQPSAATG
jgi:RNA polymerase sigma-70 factor (ECF subfamily)